MKNLGYETVGTGIDEYKYDLNISIDEEIVEENMTETLEETCMLNYILQQKAKMLK